MIFRLVLNLARLLLWPLFALRRARAAPRGAYIGVDLEGAVGDLERPRGPLWLLSRARGRGSPSVERARELARAVAKDPRVADVLLRVRGLAAGEAVLASLREVIAEIRASGKDVVAWLPDGAGNREIMLASAARLVLVGPETTVAPVGYAAERRYVKGALAHAGVEPEIFARGTYKSAGEMLVREGMSEAEREQVGALLDARFDALVTALSEGRGVDREMAKAWIEAAPHPARAAVELGLVDKVAYEDELELELGRPLQVVELDAYLAARGSGRLAPLRAPHAIGVVEVHGPIVGRARFPVGVIAAEDAIVASLRTARADPRVRGVVLHIDSPGGSAVASDRIHHEVLRLAEVKPVVAYMSNVAASGGYYIAAGAAVIVAQRETITGSIGVVAARFVVGPLLARLGVATDVEKRGAHADMGSMTRHLDAAERAIFDRELDAFYETFLGVVARGRHREVADIRPLAGGRVWSGVAAKEKGLVDVLGGFDRALAEVRQRVGPGAHEGDLAPRVVRARGKVPAPPLADGAAGAAAAAALPLLRDGLDRLGVTGLGDAAVLALHLGTTERALLYWPG